MRDSTNSQGTSWGLGFCTVACSYAVDHSRRNVICRRVARHG